MTRRGANTWARWALLCALALGVIAMHHVGTAGAAGHSMTGQPGCDGHGARRGAADRVDGR